MSPLHYLIILCNILLWIVKSDIYSCPRLRKAWHLTTEDEKQLLINGIHRLNNQGKFKHFGSTHQNKIDSTQAHNTAEFFAWHRYFLWEFENQIRKLGPEYECFAVPYWDISSDSGLNEHAYIFNSGLGGVGHVENDECVDIADNGAWSVDTFPLVHICHSEINPNDNVENGCCLKRAAGKNPLSGVSSYTHYLKKYDNFGANDGFRETTFRGVHSEAHSFVGGIWANYTHMISRYSSEDPIFYLLHSWFDYLFVVWKQCWGYNLIDSTELDSFPKAYFSWPKEDIKNGVPSSELDSPLYYVPMTDITWFENGKYQPTARSTWDEQSWNILYERGTFIARSHLTALCDSTWDDTVLLENSAESLEIIEKSKSDNEVSEVDTYQQKLWHYLLEEMTDESGNEMFSQIDILQTWDAKTCNFQRQREGKRPCYVPQSYDKCGDEDLLRDDIGIEELLAKEGVKGNDCLEEVRINTYSWAKTMGMLYNLCMGEFDKYFVCDMPNIDVMIDMDDSSYHDRLLAHKVRMEREAQNSLDMQELDVVMDNLKIRKYARFDVIRYLLIAFVIGGCAFVALVQHCKGECNNKIECHEIDYEGNSYGSMAGMM